MERILIVVALVWLAGLTYYVYQDDAPALTATPEFSGLEQRVQAVETYLDGPLDDWMVLIHNWVVQARERIDWDTGDPPPPPPPSDPPQFG